MRRVTRNAVLVVLGTLSLLLALGALPGYLQSGDPYYVEATVAETGGDGPAVNTSSLSPRRFPYTFSALDAAEAGASPARSDAYYQGPVGAKDTFSHSPFDEYAGLENRNSSAVDRTDGSPVGDVAIVLHEGQRYRLEIVRVPEGA